MHGKVYISPECQNVARETLQHAGSGDSAAGWPLTPREREVLRQVADGHAMKQIAVHLDLSVKTVETHRRQIMDKLGLHSVAELTKYAIRQGITTERQDAGAS